MSYLRGKPLVVVIADLGLGVSQALCLELHPPHSPTRSHFPILQERKMRLRDQYTKKEM